MLVERQDTVRQTHAATQPNGRRHLQDEFPVVGLAGDVNEVELLEVHFSDRGAIELAHFEMHVCAHQRHGQGASRATERATVCAASKHAAHPSF